LLGDLWSINDAMQIQAGGEPSACQSLFSLCREIENELARRLREKTADRPQSGRFESPPGPRLGWLRSAILGAFACAARRRFTNAKRKCPNRTARRRSDNFPRNEWIHQQITNGKSLKSIVEAIRKEKPGWQPLSSPQAIQRAHEAYLRELRKRGAPLANSR